MHRKRNGSYYLSCSCCANHPGIREPQDIKERSVGSHGYTFMLELPRIPLMKLQASVAPAGSADQQRPDVRLLHAVRYTQPHTAEGAGLRCYMAPPVSDHRLQAAFRASRSDQAQQ